MPNRKNLCARFWSGFHGYRVWTHLHYCWNQKRLRFICPRLITAQKEGIPYVVSYSTDAEGYLVFHLEDAEKKKHKGQILSYHTSASSVRSVLGYMREVYLLCEEKLMEGLYESVYTIKWGVLWCLCRHWRPWSIYNERADQARQHLTKVFDSDFVLFTEGRTPDEARTSMVENQQYMAMVVTTIWVTWIWPKWKLALSQIVDSGSQCNHSTFLKRRKVFKYLPFWGDNLED